MMTNQTIYKAKSISVVLKSLKMSCALQRTADYRNIVINRRNFEESISEWAV